MIYKKAVEKKDNVVDAVNAILRLVSRREYSKLEIRQKLSLKFTKETVEKALAYSIEKGYQSDDRYAEMLLNHIVFIKEGPLKFITKSKIKGIESSIIEKHLETVDWDEVLKEFLKSNKDIDKIQVDPKLKIKIISALYRRGFYKSSIFKVVKM